MNDSQASVMIGLLKQILAAVSRPSYQSIPDGYPTYPQPTLDWSGYPTYQHHIPDWAALPISTPLDCPRIVPTGGTVIGPMDSLISNEVTDGR